MADFDNGVGQALEQAIKNIQARMEQMVADMLPRLVQTAVVNAVNEYAAVRESGEAERFKVHMAHLYPILDQLGGPRPETDDKPGTSEHPEVAMLIPGAAVGQEAVAGWSQYLPFGYKDGQVLVWNQKDESWDPGEAGGINMSWQASLEDDGKEGYNVKHLGGSVEFFGGVATNFEGGTYQAGKNDAYCFLQWQAAENNGKGTWKREIKENGYPTVAGMADGDVFIPLWFLKNGVLTQETVGAILIPAVKNVVDKTE